MIARNTRQFETGTDFESEATVVMRIAEHYATGGANALQFGKTGSYQE